MNEIDPKLVNVRVRDLAPGIWEDGNGSTHFNLHEILEANGIPDTPEEREENIRLLLKVIAEKFPESEAALVRKSHGDSGPLS